MEHMTSLAVMIFVLLMALIVIAAGLWLWLSGHMAGVPAVVIGVIIVGLLIPTLFRR